MNVSFWRDDDLADVVLQSSTTHVQHNGSMAVEVMVLANHAIKIERVGKRCKKECLYLPTHILLSVTWHHLKKKHNSSVYLKKSMESESVKRQD